MSVYLLPGVEITFTFTFTFSHLADAFIQSDLQLGTVVLYIKITSCLIYMLDLHQDTDCALHQGPQWK